jgi:hypothetical protein
MAKKDTPRWKVRGEQPPPVIRGYWSYGVVYDPARDGRPGLAANLASDARWAAWSYRYWWKKVRKDWALAVKDWSRVAARLVTPKGEPELQG